MMLFADILKLINHGDKSIYLDKVMSFSMDFADSDYDVMTLSGAHLYEKKYLSQSYKNPTLLY